MTKKQELQSLLLMLANNYPQTKILEENIKAITFFIESTIGLAFNWARIIPRIALNEKYYPSAAVIVEYAQGKPQSLEQLSKKFVDEAILAFTSCVNSFERLGREKYYLAKKIGMDKFSIQNGSLDPKFMRSHWIDRAIKLTESNKDHLLLIGGDESMLNKNKQSKETKLTNINNQSLELTSLIKGMS